MQSPDMASNPPTSAVFWQPSHVDRSTREQLAGQRALTLWFTGLSASGKSTTAYALEQQLIASGHLCFVLDGDNLRHGINRDLDFTPEGRRENIRRTAEIARLMNDAGLIVIASLISPLVADRAMVKAIIGAKHFVEVYLSTPLAVCEARDPKSLYRKARQGLIPDFTGISAPYEAPTTADIHVNTQDVTPTGAAAQIMATLQQPLRVI